MSDIVFSPPEGRFHLDTTVPGDKSLTQRALVLSAMADGTSHVTGPAPGADIEAMRGALARLGVEFGEEKVVSNGLDSWLDPGGPLDLQNSGTALRLLTGALAGRPFRVTLTGDESLSRRPMRRLVGPLSALGAFVEVSPAGTAPVVTGGANLHGGTVEVPIASAQVRTAVALAAVQAEGPTSIDSPAGFRDHTERWLAELGLGRWLTRTRFEVLSGPIPPAAYRIPGDPSSAAYLWTAAALREGAVAITRRVSLNPGRTGFLDVLAQMGARVDRAVTGMVHGDPVGDVTVIGAGLKGAHVGGDLVARTIDELPLVAVCAGVADGETRVTNAFELRAKESDRIAGVIALLRALGADAEESEEGFVVAGGSRYRGGTADSFGDHRIAMAGAVAATAAAGPVTIRDFEVVAVSWPGFHEALERLWSSR